MLLRKTLIVGIVTVYLGGCTTVSVHPVSSREIKPTEVCIKRNPKVIVPELPDVIKAGFLRHGINAKTYDEIPPSCEYSVIYTANLAWSYVRYLNTAHIEIYKGKELVGSADRDAPKGIGTLELSKWDSVRTKIDPMIDELLGEVAPLPNEQPDK